MQIEKVVERFDVFLDGSDFSHGLFDELCLDGRDRGNFESGIVCGLVLFRSVWSYHVFTSASHYSYRQKDVKRYLKKPLPEGSPGNLSGN